MTAVLIAITLISHVGLPPVLIAWLWRGRPTSRTDAVLRALAAMLFLGVLSVGGAGWTWFGVYLRWIFLAGAIVAAVRSIARCHASAGGSPRPPLAKTILFFGVPSALFGLTLLAMLTGWRCPDGAVALHFPLRSGTFAIGHGGSNLVLNRHAAVKAQAFAVDIVKLNALGMRARGLLPRDPEDFAIYGEPVYSPCDGEVLAAVDAAADPGSPRGSRQQVGGNHVVVYCEGVSVLLANLKPGSVRVAEGARVSSDDEIGEVGDTGNASEPHLHVHAVRGRQTDPWRLAATGEPVPIRFDGRFLVRNDRVTMPTQD